MIPPPIMLRPGESQVMKSNTELAILFVLLRQTYQGSLLMALDYGRTPFLIAGELPIYNPNNATETILMLKTIIRHHAARRFPYYVHPNGRRWDE